MLAAASLLACTEQADTAEGTHQDQSALTAMTLEESSLRFTINKWADSGGVEKIPVSGSFLSYQVAASEQAQTARSLEELEGLSAAITVDLTSVDTGMEMRDSNVTRHYFETSAFGSASFRLHNLRAQNSGTSGLVLVDGELDLHGYTQRFEGLALRMERLPHAWKVETTAPIEVRSADFGMPVAALLAVCGHAGIDDAANVEVALTIAGPAD